MQGNKIDVYSETLLMDIIGSYFDIETILFFGLEFLTFIIFIWLYFKLKKVANKQSNRGLQLISKGFLYFGLAGIITFIINAVILLTGLGAFEHYSSLTVAIPYTLFILIGLIFFIKGAKNLEKLE